MKLSLEDKRVARITAPSCRVCTEPTLAEHSARAGDESMRSGARAQAGRIFSMLGLLLLLCAPNARAQNEIQLENALPGNAASEWDITGAGDPGIQGFATDISVNPGETVDFKVDTTSQRLPPRHLPPGLLRRASARARSRPSTPSVALPQTQPACLTDARTGLVDCGNWAVSASGRVPANAVVGHLLRQARPRGPTAPAGEPHRLRRPRRRRRLRPPVPDLRHDLAGLQRLRRQQPVRRRTRSRSGAPTRSATTGRSRRAATRPRTWSSTPSTRWSAGSSATATTSATRPASTPTAAAPSCSSTRCSCPSATTSTGPAAQRANVEAARAAGVQPRVLQRQRGVLEDALGAEHRRRRRRRTARSSRYKETHANAKIDPRRRSGPAPGATRASARRPTAAGPRTR